MIPLLVKLDPTENGRPRPFRGAAGTEQEFRSTPNPGVLAPPPDQQPRSFEIIFETPALMPLDKQAEAAQTALLAMLTAHRGFIAHAQYL